MQNDDKIALETRKFNIVISEGLLKDCEINQTLLNLYQRIISFLKNKPEIKLSKEGFLTARMSLDEEGLRSNEPNLRIYFGYLGDNPQELGLISKISIPSKMEFLSLVRDFTTSLVNYAGFEGKELFSIPLCVDEILSNAFEHGNKKDPHKTVEIYYSLHHFFDQRIFYIVTGDKGPGFELVINKNLTSHEEVRKMKPRGRGLFIINSYADVFHSNYPDRNGNGNFRVGFAKIIPTVFRKPVLSKEQLDELAKYFSSVINTYHFQ